MDHTALLSLPSAVPWISLGALGAANGDGPGGIFLMDAETF